MYSPATGYQKDMKQNLRTQKGWIGGRGQVGTSTSQTQ